MKTLYLGPKENMSLPFVLTQLKKLASILIVTLFSLSAFSQEVVFGNPVLETGDAVLNNKHVLLNWATSEINVSHFVLEKSTNGKNYKDAGVLFTEGQSPDLTVYRYKDALRPAEPVVYYRLRVVELDGRETFSAVRMIWQPSPGKKRLELLTFPNPVAKELRITIPEGWQNRQVTYQLYDDAGRLLKQVSSKKASQTEVLNLQSFQGGTFLVCAFTNEERLTQSIIKN